MGKREATTARLQSFALNYFEKEGYEESTVAEIARAAGVTPMTFYRHFATKDIIVAASPWDPELGSFIGTQPPHWPALQRVIAGVVHALIVRPPDGSGSLRARIRSSC